MSESVYTVTGMSCAHCSAAVTRELTAVDGVDTVEVEVADGRVTVRSSAPVSVDQVRTAIARAGYELVGA
ncbi:heavy-metal-associated domain-containing protein [Nocardia niwae]|uniref:Heavy-metal-associated domain-containing protein n=1 Tax=Nocardia niwae TaxID=626084 RepID=A0ABV2X992_9NOCA|nr:heavy-metal-associated domain-containing protein [Nocardia niwae]